MSEARYMRSGMDGLQPGRVFLRCVKHGSPYSVYYGKPGQGDRESALRRVEEFRLSHGIYSPECLAEGRVEDVPPVHIVEALP